MPKIMGSLCPDCDGTGTQYKVKKMMINGKVEAKNIVEEVCKRCGGTGHVK